MIVQKQKRFYESEKQTKSNQVSLKCKNLKVLVKYTFLKKCFISFIKYLFFQISDKYFQIFKELNSE